MSAHPNKHPPVDLRLSSLRAWLDQVLDGEVDGIRTANADASFRRYFRVHVGDQRYIAMDAPPEQEDCSTFTRVARTLRLAGLHAPRILAEDPASGFVLLEDLGDTLYLDRLNADTATEMYQPALDALVCMQRGVDGRDFPAYDRALLLRELKLFEHWCLDGWLGLRLLAAERHLLQHLFDALIDQALTQTRVFVHRDYHSRNLLWQADGNNPGIIDFQDAVHGPVTYDAVSLLRDCYIRCPEPLLETLLHGFHQALWDCRLIRAGSEQFRRWFDHMGVQRHLKAIGIFCRLCLRDGKPDYMDAIPRTLEYVLAQTARYPAFSAFDDFLRQRVAPAVRAKQHTP